jgi:hypothetical protein
MEVVNESAIQIDRGTQFRARLNEDRVKEYSELFDASCEWPFDTPCEVFFDGSEYFLVDGFHRYHAARKAGFDGIVCNVRKGTLRDAIKFALSANAKHGLHRSNEDKRKAVAFALSDKEWSKFSSRALADMCGVSNRFVENLRQETTVNGSQLDDKRTGKDGKERKQPELKPKTTSEPVVDVWEDVEDEDEPEPVKPSKPLPKTVMSQSPQELVASIHAAGETLLALVKEVNRLSDQVGGEWIDCQEVETRAKALRKLIRGFAHWVDCPKCNGKGCDECKRRGWLSVERKQYLSQEMKDLLEVA